MKKIMLIAMLMIMVLLSGCQQQVKCGAGTRFEDGKCIAADVNETPTCDFGYELNESEDACVKIEEPLQCSTGYELNEAKDACVLIEVEEECNIGYHKENGVCVLDIVDVPDWFDGWGLLSEPVGDFRLNVFDFTDTGFSVNLPAGKRVGINKNNLVLETGYSYEVTFDYSSSVDGLMIFAQLQGHGGNAFTHSAIVTSETVQTFSDTLPMPTTTTGTNNGWLTIELLPNGFTGTITIDNIQIIKTALPTCADNEVLKGLECIPANNGFDPNGTPTAWFDGWEILTNPIGNKDISDYHFTETGFTAYLDHGERTGIQLLDYNFESGYTYELTFDYTASEAGRMIWVQMEALGGHGFTNTDTWSIDGTATFSQTLIVPSDNNPVELGWIKLEFTPGALDNVTIENIQIIKTPIS